MLLVCGCKLIGSVDSFFFAEHTAGKASQGGTFNAATSTSPIQDPRVSEDYQSASEQVHLCFPCLDVTSLNKREEEILCFSLWQQSKELRSEFSDLCTSTYLSLERRNVLINKLVICITGDDSLKSFVEDQNKSILADRKKELFEAKDISKVWEIAGDYISFFNYYLIEKIIKRFGTKKDKETLAEYKTSFTEYAKRSFRQSPAEYVSRNETDSVIKVKLGAPKYEHSTLDQLEQFIDELSKLLKLTHAGVIRLCRILPGCVELTLLAPSFVESAVFPLSPDQEAALKALGVIRLRCGVYTYPSEVKINMCLIIAFELLIWFLIKFYIKHILSISMQVLPKQLGWYLCKFKGCHANNFVRTIHVFNLIFLSLASFHY